MNVHNSTLINDIYNSRLNIISYLKKQGYDTSQYEKFTVAEVNAMKQASEDSSQLNFEVVDSSDPEKKCQVRYHLKPSIKKSTLQDIVSDFYEYGDYDKEKCSIIIITISKINDTITNTVRELWEKYQEYCMVFNISALQYNVLEHDFVPDHQKLSSEEKAGVFEKYNILNDKQLPEISMFDPVAKAILLRPGELCKITRYDKISYTNEFFRICVI